MKNVKKVCLTAALAVMTTMTTGCTFPNLNKIVGEPPETPPEKENVSVVISPTANEPTPDISHAYDIIYDASYSYGFRNIIVDDGNPFEAINGNLSQTEHNAGLSDANKELDGQAYTKEFIKSAEQVSALTEEKDTAKALEMAANSLNGLEGKKTIVLIDNAVSTSGRVALKSFKGFDVQASLDNLNECDLPDLSGIDSIIWYDFGSTIEPQPSLSNADINSLREFWVGYLTKSGVNEEDITIKNAVNTNKKPNKNLPAVSIVETTVDLSVICNKKIEDVNKEVENIPDEEKDSVMSSELDNGIKIDEKILFAPDSTQIADKERVTEILRPTAEYLISSNEKIIIFGTTAADFSSADKCVGFSLKRAASVKNLLTEMGVAESQIICKGLGYDNEFHVNDLKDDGTFNEHAPQNRAVFIYSADSDTGRKYID